MALRGSEDLWIIEPLLEAGLDIEEVRTLLTRVSFESVVTDGLSDVSDATVFLGFRSPAVQAAWIETVDRMLRLTQPRPWS
jgi:hypothetical protein